MTNSDADYYAFRARGWATKKGQGDTKQNKNKAPRELRLCLVYRKLAGFQRHCTKGDRQHNTKLKPSSTVCVCLFVLYAKSLLKNKGKKKKKNDILHLLLLLLVLLPRPVSVLVPPLSPSGSHLITIGTKSH